MRFFVLMFAMFVSHLGWTQTSAPGDIALSDYYSKRPKRFLQCFMSKTNSKNKADNLRQFYEINLGPIINYFYSTQSRGYVSGALVSSDEKLTELRKPLTVNFAFEGSAQDSVFQLVLTRIPTRRADPEWYLMEKLTATLLKNVSGVGKTSAGSPYRVAAGNTENLSVMFDPTGETPSNFFVVNPKAIRGNISSIRQSFESGESFFLQCHVCAPSVVGSCFNKKEYNQLFDPEFFKSPSDPNLKQTDKDATTLNFQM